jgi:hypothetical protein
MARQLFAFVLTASVLAILCLSSPSEATNIEEDYGCTYDATVWQANDCSGPDGGHLVDVMPWAKTCSGARFFGYVGSFLVDCTVKQAYFYPYPNCQGEPQSLPNGICTTVVMPTGGKFSIIMFVNESLSH